MGRLAAASATLAALLGLPWPAAAITTRLGDLQVDPSPEEEVRTITAETWAEHSKIPYQLVTTAKTGTPDDLPARMWENLNATLALNPGLRLRFLNDSQCADFIAANNPELLSAFSGEDFGPYRGDICRAAVVTVEGGFYADLDVQFSAPFSQFVDQSTSFLTSYDYSCHMLNALFAAEPRNFVMESVLNSIKDWYSHNRTAKKMEWMGTATMYAGLEKAIKRECPYVNLIMTRRFQFNCGHQQGYGRSIRLYREKRLRCGQDEWLGKVRVPDNVNEKWDENECPTARRVPAYSGKRFGIFEPGPERKLVAWSRFEGCEGWHCENRRMARGAADAVSDADTASQSPACKA